MSRYVVEPSELTQEAIRVRIYPGQLGPVAMLHRAGPATEGAEYLFVSEGAFPVPAQLAVAEKIAQRSGCEVFIRLEGVEWDADWGELTA
jgi:hypothetical protein